MSNSTYITNATYSITANIVTNSTYNRSRFDYRETFSNDSFGDYASYKKNIEIANHSVKVFVFLFGSAINVWLLLVILLDKNLRTRLRNQLICSLFTAYLIDTLSESPIMISDQFRTYFLSCTVIKLRVSIALIQDSIENWIFITLIAVFLAQLLNLDLESKLGPKATKVGKTFVLLFPWIVVLVLVPVVVSQNVVSETFRRLTICHKKFILQIIASGHDISVLGVAVLLLASSAVLKFIKFAMRSPSGGGSGVQREAKLVDPIMVYVLGVALLLVFQLPYLALPLLDYTLFFSHWEFQDVAYMWMGVEIVNDARHVFMPLIWLLLPEIRRRARTWRSCCRRSQAVDLVILYRKNADQA